MHAQLKNIDDPNYDWDNYRPKFLQNFSIWLSLSIGPSDAETAETFQLFVCTPIWLEEHVSQEHSRWGANTLVVDRFDKNKIENELEKVIRSISGGTWGELRAELCRFMVSEYDGMEPV